MGEQDLTTGTIESFVVGKSAGFAPPLPAGQCRPTGSWSYDFATKKLTGNGCSNATPTQVDRTLSDAEHARVRSAISKVRVAKRPTACPTDMPVAHLDITRTSTQRSYIDARAACGMSATPVTEVTLGDLVTLMQELSAPAVNSAPCVRTGCSGQLCADTQRVTTCQVVPGNACYHAAICERDADGHCGFRQTSELTACLGQ